MLNIKKNKIFSVKEYISSKFSGLKFDEESHTYTLKGNKLTSTSTYIKKRFTNKFEGYKIAKAMADSFNKKNPDAIQRDPFYYLYRWKQISTASTETGSRVHNYAEFNYPHFYDSPSCIQEQGVYDFYNNLDSKYVVLFMELKMYNEKYLKAGTADIIFYNTETNKIIIGDYKTNQKNLHQVYKGQRMLGEFSDLYDNHLNAYSLQLSDYQNMLELATNLEVEDRWIIHLNTQPIDQYDMGKSYPKYELDLSNPPVKETETYKIYRLVDYTDRLKKDYEKWIIGQ